MPSVISVPFLVRLWYAHQERPILVWVHHIPPRCCSIYVAANQLSWLRCIRERHQWGYDSSGMSTKSRRSCRIEEKSGKNKRGTTCSCPVERPPVADCALRAALLRRAVLARAVRK